LDTGARKFAVDGKRGFPYFCLNCPTKQSRYHERRNRLSASVAEKWVRTMRKHIFQSERYLAYLRWEIQNMSPKSPQIVYAFWNHNKIYHVLNLLFLLDLRKNTMMLQVLFYTNCQSFRLYDLNNNHGGSIIFVEHCS